MRRDRLEYVAVERTAPSILDHGREILLPKDEHLRPDPKFLRTKAAVGA